MKVTAVVVLVLLFLAPSVISQAPDDKLIVPGQRIGKWTLDMSLPDLLQMNGPPREEQSSQEIDLTSGDWWNHEWLRIGLIAVTDGRNGPRVVLLAANSETFKTAKGIGPHSSRQDAEDAYPKPTAVTSWGTACVCGSASKDSVRLIYDESGLAFRLNCCVVDVVYIFRPGTAKTSWKF